MMEVDCHHHHHRSCLRENSVLLISENFPLHSIFIQKRVSNYRSSFLGMDSGVELIDFATVQKKNWERKAEHGGVE